MLRGNKNFNIAGSASGLGLLLLAFLLVNPLVGGSASALEVSGDEADSVETGEPAAQAEVLTSTVSFAFGDPVGVTTLTPVSESGASARYSVKATVGVENSGGYTVYLGSNKSELTGKNSGATINGVTSSSSYEDLPVNSWGYNATEGETAGTSFSRMPENVRGVALGGNDASNIKSDSKTFMLSFAAHIGNDKPADTYENEATLSVVSSPLEVTNDFGIITMQEMTSIVCANATDLNNDGEISAQLKDTRDGKYYWVNKLADGKCWMTQNLDLDLSTSVALTPEDSDVTSNWTPSSTTASTVSSATICTNNTSQCSWNMGSYRITNPTEASDCGSKKNSASQCTGQFTAYTTPLSADGDADAHYIIGNLYAWNTATAGVGSTTATTDQASDSICARGWKLPLANSTAIGSFGGLLNKYSIATGQTAGIEKLTSVPLYFVRGGRIEQDANVLFSYAGNHGYYWSSTPYSVTSDAYRFSFSGTNTVSPSSRNNRRNGFSVRCIAR